MAATTIHVRTQAVAVITCTGKAFCSEADADALARVPASAPDEAYELPGRAVSDRSVWDRALESELARQMWSLARTKES